MLSVRHRSVRRRLGLCSTSTFSIGPSWWVCALAVSASLGTSACGGGDADAMKKRVATLQDELTLLQNDVDRLEERLAAVETRPQVQSSASEQEKASAGTLERPRLKVIKLEPGASSASSSPTPEEPVSEAKDTDEPRPVIRGSGDQVESELPPASGGRDHG
jgi:hypothetical protein